jgi:peptidoglycan/LPS O-acetylase OafA/YrhL
VPGGEQATPIFFPNLDALRFCAFFVVYLEHGFSIGGLGDVGVSFFFVLSGFLITYLILAETEATGSVDVKAFYIRRILRIWPLYYAVVLFAFVIYPALKNAAGFPGYIDTGRPLLYCFFLGNFDVMGLGPHRGAMSTNITWSVCIEEQFYLTWPLFFAILPRKNYKWIFPGIILVSILFRSTSLANPMVMYFHTMSVISDMAVGGLCAYLAMNSFRFRAFFEEMPQRVILATYCLGLLLVVFRGSLYDVIQIRPFERLVLSAFFAFIVLEQNYCRESLFKMGRLRRISELGKRTYGLYLLHPIALLAVIDLQRLLGVNGGDWHWVAVGGLAALAVSIALAVASYRCYEQPFLRLKRAYTRLAPACEPALRPVGIDTSSPMAARQ